MDERYMEKERQNGKIKGWGIERKMLIFWKLFLFLDKNVSRNPKAHGANKALLYGTGRTFWRCQRNKKEKIGTMRRTF
jgi:hypothetical protein